ncbi:MAG: VanW family protein [Clostridium sp.]|uniref:VanW family protein n=1 Tax=Clostridium sp. TaxID=1506 RepID=UPI002FCC970E
MKSRVEKTASKDGSKRKKQIIIASIALIVLVCGGIGAYALSINSTVKEWNNKIYPGVTVGGIDLSGKTKEEGMTLLKDNFSNKILDKKIVVKIKDKDKEYDAKYSELEPHYEIEKAVDEAFSYGKDSNVFEQNSIIKKGTSDKHEIQLNFTYSEKNLNNLEDKMIKKFNIAPKNAKMNISSGGNISITPETVGYGVNKEELNKSLKENINGDLDTETLVQLEYKEDKPKVTKEELSKINGVIGSSTSSYQSSDANRSANIAAATEFVNGTLLMPGEVFSYSEATQRDKSKYKEGNVYINDKVEKDIGGGICQVSSALYRAVMKANIRPVERHNHSMTVGYAKPGLDATVAWGYLDLKIKNTYDTPIYILGTTYNKTVDFKVYGDTKELNGKTYDMVNEIVKTIPSTQETINDPSLPEGTRVVESAGITGYVAKGYQVTYENGKVIKKELISTDTYKMIPQKIKVGTKKK